MRIAVEILKRYTSLPEDLGALRLLLDDLGLEVKRLERTAQGPVFTLELLANRGDHHCYAGVAREITGRTGGELSLPAVAPLLVGAGPVEVRIETPLCLRYSATLLERVGEPRPLEAADLATLEAAGIHSLSAPVDATNLSNLELGQPTHAFDADKIKGAVVVRQSRAGERAWLLFQPEPRELPEGALVIADDEKILAVAGVIGCEDSKTTADSRRILLESATFDPVAVRKASRALNVHTDASARFERGADPELPLVGAGRVVGLLEGTGSWRRVGLSALAGDWKAPDQGLALTPETIRQSLEIDLSADEAAGRLRRYGFGVEVRGDELLVRIPSWRIWDVEFVADILEELARSIGYNNTPISLPPVALGALPSPSEQIEASASEVLVGAGFYEVITDGFYGRSTFEKLGLPEGHPLWAHVETTNALDRASGLLKNNALLQAVDAAASNLRRKVEDGRIFEWTRTFHPDPAAPNGVNTERRLLWATVWGVDRARGWDSRPRPADIWTLKGLVEEIGLALGLPLRVGELEEGAPLATLLHSSLLHPGRRGAVLLGDQVVGLLGEVHPAVLRAFGVKRERPCYLEISADALLAPGRRGSYVEPSPLQPIDRSLAFTLPHGFSARRVSETLVAHGPDWLRTVKMTDVFHHEEGGAPVRTVTFALRLDQRAPARTAEEINAALSGLIDAVVAALGAEGVRLRA